MSRRALITGVGGQDGIYLCELLLQRGYMVHGLLRHDTSSRSPNPDLVKLASANGANLTLLHGEILDPFYILKILQSFDFDEIYHFAAQSHVGASFDIQLYTCDVNALGTLKIIQAIVVLKLEHRVKFYNACTSEVFGQQPQHAHTKQDEATPFKPASPYAAAKAFSFWITANSRASHGLFAVNGILFNHESPRRGLDFVTRKITHAVAQIYVGEKRDMSLGNLDAERDWGHARDYVRGIHAMMQHHTAGDYVLATGQSRSVREFATMAFEMVNITLEWSGKGIDEVGREQKTGIIRIRVDSDLYRPTDVTCLRGCADKARDVLGWTPEVDFKSLVQEMVYSDIALLRPQMKASLKGLRPPIFDVKSML